MYTVLYVMHRVERRIAACLNFCIPATRHPRPPISPDGTCVTELGRDFFTLPSNLTLLTHHEWKSYVILATGNMQCIIRIFWCTWFSETVLPIPIVGPEWPHCKACPSCPCHQRAPAPQGESSESSSSEVTSGNRRALVHLTLLLVRNRVDYDRKRSYRNNKSRTKRRERTTVTVNQRLNDPRTFRREWQPFRILMLSGHSAIRRMGNKRPQSSTRIWAVGLDKET